MLRAAEITISKGRQFFKVSLLVSGDNGMAGAMINEAFFAKKKPEVALRIKLVETLLRSTALRYPLSLNVFVLNIR